LTFRLATRRGGFGFIVAQELPEFSGTMAVFAIETRLGVSSQKKSHVFP